MKGTWKDIVVNILGWQARGILCWFCGIGPPRSGVQLSCHHAAA